MGNYHLRLLVRILGFPLLIYTAMGLADLGLWPLSLGVIAALGWWAYQIRFGTYIVRTKNSDGSRYTDHRRCWNHELVKRTIIVPGQYFAEGPLSVAGKFHGRWRVDNYVDRSRSRYVWYWYGEEVTEGEFALRSR